MKSLPITITILWKPAKSINSSSQALITAQAHLSTSHYLHTYLFIGLKYVHEYEVEKKNLLTICLYHF